MKLPLLCAVAAATSALSLGAFAQSPSAQVDPNVFLNQFESTFGKFEGYRRSGAKGICAAGEFVGTADARGLSTSTAFSGKPVPVLVRFSVGGANPNAPDNSKSQRTWRFSSTCPVAKAGKWAISQHPCLAHQRPSSFWAG